MSKQSRRKDKPHTEHKTAAPTPGATAPESAGPAPQAQVPDGRIAWDTGQTWDHGDGWAHDAHQANPPDAGAEGSDSGSGTQTK